MKRRTFIKKTGVAAAGIMAAPYILPGGRLFAATGSRKANHVVFCLFAGGVRNFESVQKADGNLMKGILNGNENISADIAAGMHALPPLPVSSPLQNIGTLFKEFRFNEGPTGHYNGHTTALTGVYASEDISIKDPPKVPTIFELYRKHSSPSKSALNAWWVSNALGPYPALNFSKYAGYGAEYGGNFIHASSIISLPAYNSLGNPKVFSTAENSSVEKIRGFCDHNFSGKYMPGDAGVTNSAEDAAKIEAFLTKSFNDAVAGMYNDPWGVGNAMNDDMFNVFAAENILKEFEPELLVVNMQGVDICHTDFTQYCNNMRKADWAVNHLWQTIQNTPGMKDDTIMIIAPEHGRNLKPNTLVDQYGRYAIDHTNDEISRQIFCLIIGPPSVVKQAQVISNIEGESVDIVPTIANILGFDNDIPPGMLQGKTLSQAFS